MVEYGPIDVLGCYFPPSLNREEFEAALNDIESDILGCFPRSVVVGGDFAARLGLVLLNQGRVSTFVGGREKSIVDVTWASLSALNEVRGWKVEPGSLSELSDHRFICMELVSSSTEVREQRRRQQERKRWVLKKLDP